MKRGVAVLLEYLLLSALFLTFATILSRALATTHLSISSLVVKRATQSLVDALATTIHVCTLYGKCKIDGSILVSVPNTNVVMCFASSDDNVIICGSAFTRYGIIPIGKNKVYCRFVPYNGEVVVEGRENIEYSRKVEELVEKYYGISTAFKCIITKGYFKVSYDIMKDNRYIHVVLK